MSFEMTMIVGTILDHIWAEEVSVLVIKSLSLSNMYIFAVSLSVALVIPSQVLLAVEALL